MHTRQTIREAVVSGLAASLALFAIVEDSPMRDVQSARLPLLAVYSSEEVNTQEVFNIASPLQRQFTLKLRLMVQQLDDAQKKADDLCEKIEQAMVPILSQPQYQGHLERTAEPEFIADAERPTISVDLFYLVTYHTQANGPAFYS